MPSTLPRFSGQLQDARLKTLLFRNQVRNWPETLNPEQRAESDEFRNARLLDGDAGADGSLAGFAAAWAEAETRADTEAGREALKALLAWRDALLGDFGIELQVLLPASLR